MKISVVIPTYNGSRFVAEAIESVLKQTRPADEIIISDDNSTDNTLEICSRFGDKIKIFRNENGPSGFVNGWNNAMAYATGEYISILHQDDLLAPEFLENITTAIDKYPDVKHFFTPCNYIDGHGDVIKSPDEYCNGELHYYTGLEYARAYMFVKDHIHRCPGVVTHRDIFSYCKYRAEAGHIADDDFFLRVGNFTDVVGILKPLSSYREHSSSETGHLNIIELPARLVRDYDFQLKHLNDNPLLTEEFISLFKENKRHFIRRVLAYSLIKRNFTYLKRILKYI